MGVSGRDMIKMTRYYSEAGRRNRRVDKISMNLGRIGCHQRQAKEPTWHSRGRDLGTSSGAAARTPAEPKRKARARQKGKKRVEAGVGCPEGRKRGRLKNGQLAPSKPPFLGLTLFSPFLAGWITLRGRLPLGVSCPEG